MISQIPVLRGIQVRDEPGPEISFVNSYSLEITRRIRKCLHLFGHGVAARLARKVEVARWEPHPPCSQPVHEVHTIQWMVFDKNV